MNSNIEKMVTPLAKRGRGIILSDSSVLSMDRDVKVILESRHPPPANCSSLMGVAKVMNCTNENGLTLENLLKRRKVELPRIFWMATMATKVFLGCVNSSS